MNAYFLDSEFNEEALAKLKSIVQGYTLQGHSGAWRVHGWWLARLSLAMGNAMDCNVISRQWHNIWQLDTYVDPLIFCLLRNIPVNGC